MVPIGPDGLSADDAARRVRQLEPTITIPVGYSPQRDDADLKAFLTALGLTPEEPVARLSLQSRGAAETQRVVLLEARG